MPTLANFSRFTFKGDVFTVTSIAAQAPAPELADMTAINAPVAEKRLVPTGAYSSPGELAVECLGFTDPKNLVGQVGQAEIQTSIVTFTRNVVCSAASVEARTGDLLRLRLTLTPTDYFE